MKTFVIVITLMNSQGDSVTASPFVTPVDAQSVEECRDTLDYMERLLINGSDMDYEIRCEESAPELF